MLKLESISKPIDLELYLTAFHNLCADESADIVLSALSPVRQKSVVLKNGWYLQRKLT
jgi:hypothetical protein